MWHIFGVLFTYTLCYISMSYIYIILCPAAAPSISILYIWSPLLRAFIDVRIFNPQVQINWKKVSQLCTVMSTSGGLSKECDKLVRQIAMKLSLKRGERYSDIVGFIRRRLRFDLLRTCVIALRGFKKNAAPEKIEDLEFNLRPVAANY